MSVRYKVGTMRRAVMQPGDKLCLSLTNFGERTVVHEEKFTSPKIYTHWAFVDIPNIGDAIFCGNDQLEDYIIETFPGCVKVKSEEALLI